MTRPRDVFVAGILALLPGLAGCTPEELPDPTEVVDPAALFWDHLWTFRGTYVELRDGTTVPYVTDAALLERIRYGQDGGPPASDVLEGAEVTFEIDGRVLVKPAGAEAAEYWGTDYRVVDDVLMRASIRKSIWFPYTYMFDEASHTLLIQPEEGAGGAVMDFVMEIVQRTLYSGALDSAAARITTFLFEDPRVVEAIDAFLFDLINGAIAEVPVQDPEDVTAWIIGVLREAGLVEPGVPDAVLEAVIQPIVEEILPLDREGIAQALVDRLLESDAISKIITPDRVERVLTFALYRRVFETGDHLHDIERLDILLEEVPVEQAP
jgi:hypothetical protein